MSFQTFAYYFNHFVLGYYTVANAVYAVLLITALWQISIHLKRVRYGYFQDEIHVSVCPPVSILISAYNEEANIVETIRSLLKISYPSYEIIILNDGSKDGTLERLIEAFNLEPIDLIYRPIIETAAVKGFYLNPEIPNLTLVDTEHSGKADSLNIGINVSRSPYFCSVDADSIIEPEAITRLMRPVIEHPELVKASGGIVRIANGSAVKSGQLSSVSLPDDTLSRLQIVEYTRSFLFGRLGLSALNSLLIISGTFSLFHKRSVQQVGGYRNDKVAEDMDLVVSIHKYFREKKERYKVTFVPDPICWTEAPKSFYMLRRQRRRWHTGLGQSLWTNKRMILNPRYGIVGLFGMPYFAFVEYFGPLIETVGYVVVIVSFYMGIIDAQFFYLFMIMAVFIGVFFSTGAVLLEEMSYKRYPSFKDVVTLFLYGILDNFGYRQLNGLWRTQAILKNLFRRHKWEHVDKSGFDEHEEEKLKAEALLVTNNKERS